ncbi:MAG TPA: hypothetical protein VG816_06515, partial [Solirubrobacterales bacterium]|nr:hypothetical protein [Solirubrobacterales bacterium]
NSVGGATGSGSPAAGDWYGIVVDGENASVDIEHARLSYAGTALKVYGSGHSLMRGSMAHNGVAIAACDWGTGCSIDAAYVDWGDAGGPSTPNYVCGAVTTAPYISAGEVQDAESFSKNCGNQPTPWEELETGQDAFNLGVANTEIRCAELGDDVCEAISTAFNCLSGAFEVGAGQLPFALPNPFSGGVAGSEWEGGAKTVASAGAKWLSTSADSEVSDFGTVVGRGLQIVGVASTVASLADAYGSCAP